MPAFSPNKSHNNDLVKIGQAAEILGVSIDTVRRWEAKGKILSIRTPGGTRLYSKNYLESIIPAGAVSQVEESKFDLHNLPVAEPVKTFTPPASFIQYKKPVEIADQLPVALPVPAEPSIQPPISKVTVPVFHLAIFLILIVLLTSVSVLAKSKIGFNTDKLLALNQTPSQADQSLSSEAIGQVLAASNPAVTYLQISTDASISGSLSVQADARINGSLTAPRIVGDTNLAGNFTVTGNGTYAGALNSQTLAVAGTASVGTNLTLGAVKTSFYTGNGLPANSLGTNGDYYYRKDGTTTDTSIYYKVNGSWSAAGAVTLKPITFEADSGSGDIKLGDVVKIIGGGINTTSFSGGTITVTGTEADTLATVTARGGQTSSDLTLSSSSNSITAGTLTATGGTIDGISIGNTTPSTGAFTTLSASSAVSLSGLASSSGTSLCLDGSNQVVTCTAGSSSGTLQSAYDNGNTITTTSTRNVAVALGTGLTTSFTVSNDGTASSIIVDDTNAAINNALEVKSNGVSNLTINENGVLSTSGNILTTGSGTITSAGLLSGSSGITVSGGTANINTSGSSSTAIGNGSGNFSVSSTGLNVSTGGALTGVSSLDTISTNATSLTFNAAGSVTAGGIGDLALDAGSSGAVNIASNSTGNVNLAGGSSSTGCTVTNSNGDFTCTGNIIGSSAGTIGYWTRSGTSLFPANSGDSITTSGNISTSGSGTLTIAGTTNLNGDTILGSSTSSLITFTGRIANGTSLIPAVDLSSDLGSATNRFNNLYVGNINSNSTISTTGQAIFTYSPLNTTYAESSVEINPTTALANSNLLGIGISGAQRAGIDAEGDLNIGYAGGPGTSVPTSNNPFNVYGHNTSNVASIDTSGNASFSGTGQFGSTLTASNGLTLTTGALNLTASSGTLALTGLSASSISAGSNNLTFTAGNFNTTSTGINNTAIGATTASSGAFTTLSASSTVTFNGLAGASGTAICLDGSNNLVTCSTGSSVGTLQSDYNNGNTITTTSGRNLAVTLASGLGTPTSLTLTNNGTGDAFDITGGNSSGTSTNGLLVNQTGAGTMTNGVNISQTSGAITNGLTFSGTFTNIINSPVFSVVGGASVVNGFTLTTGTTGTAPTLAAGGSGSDTNLGLNINSKGTGTIALSSANAIGTTTTSAFTLTDNSLTSGTGAYFTSSSLTTGKLVDISNTSNSQTSGSLLNLSSTATSLTSGSLLTLDYSPSSTTATGDLLSLNIGSGASAFTGNLLNLKNNGSSIFSVNQNQITASVPTQFTAPGDVSIAYDLNFTNPVASFIKSQSALTLQAGEPFGSSDISLNTFNEGDVVVNSNAITSSAFNVQAPAITTGNAELIQANALTTGNALSIASTSTAGGGSGNSYLLNLTRSGANANASHVAYGLFSSVTNTGTTSTNIGGDFTATGASTNYGLKVEALTGATSTGLDIGALSGATTNIGINIGTLGTATTSTGVAIGALSSATSNGLTIGAFTGTTANTGINIGAISGTGTGTAITAGNISSTGTTNYGLQLGTLAGASTSNYQIQTGNITAHSSAINAGLVIGTTKAVTGAAASSTNYGININQIDSTGTSNTGLNIGALSGATTSNGIAIGALSSATSNGVTIGALSGATANTGLSVGNITSAATANNFGINIGSITSQASATSYALNTGAISGAGTATYGINLGANSSTATTNYGEKIGALSGAGTTNYGLYVDTVTGAGTNYAAYFAGGNVNIQGLGVSSAVYTDSSHNLTTAAPTTGAIGYWSRSGTTLSPTTAGDAVTTSGNISTTGSGTITSAGLLTGSAGLTVSGGAVSLNDSSNNNTSINGGSSTGSVTVGNALAGAIALSTGSTFGVTTTTGSQTFTSAVASTATTSSAFVFTDNSLNTGTGAYFSSTSLTTGNLAQISTGAANTLTSGNLLSLTSTSTGLTSGSLLSLDYSPASTTATGDLLSLNIGSGASTFAGNLLNLKNNGSSVFSVSPNQVTSNVPTQFTSPGDVAIAYDINLTNPTASFIKSQAPLNIQAGESFNSSNLTLKTFNEGQVVIDSAAAVNSALYVTGDTITTGNGEYITANGLTTGNALAIASTSTAGGGSGNSYLLNLARSGANANASHVAYGISSSVTDTGTTSTNIGGDFIATGATTNYGLKVEALTGATSTGVGIGALSGATANTGVSIGAITSAATANNFGINIGAITSQASATSYALNTGAISGAGTATYGINLGANSSTATTNYGEKIGALSGAGTTNYGLYVDTVTGASTNYAAYFAGGNVNIQGLTASSAIYTDSSHNLTATAPTTGAIGYWSRSGTTLSPTTSGDLISGNGGLTITGAGVSLNDSSNFNTSINGGNSTGSITIGNAAASAIALSTGSTFGVTTTTGSQTFTSAVASTATTSSAFVLTDNSLNTGTGLYLSSTSLTTGNLAQISTGAANTLTSGNLLSLTSTSTGLTSGSLLSLDYSPASSTATGDLLSLNIGSGATAFAGNLFNLKNNGSSLFAVSPTQVTANIPAQFTAPGDVSIAYDINFTNPTASFIKSQAPITIQSGEVANSSYLTLKTFNEGSVVVDSAAAVGSSLYISSDTVTTGNGEYITANGLTTGSALNIASTSTAGGGSGNSYLLNLTRSGANANASHVAYGINSSVTNTGTTSTNIAGLFTVGGATTSKGIQITGLSSATSTGVDVGALTGTTANTGLNIGAISGTATGAGISVGAISTTGTTNYGINLGTLTGASSSNYQIQTGNITAVASATNAGLVIGTTKAVTGTAASSTNYGININALDSTGTSNTGLNIGNLSGATTSTGVAVGTLSSATSTGLSIGALSGATANKGIDIGAITAAATATNFSINIGAITPQASSTVASIQTSGIAAGAGTATYGINLGTNASTATSNYGINIGNVTGAGTTNYGLVLGTVSGGTTNYGELLQGTWFTGGSSTTTKPQLLIEPSGTTSTAWSTSGTGLGVNSAQTFAGNLLDLQQASKSVFSVAGVSTAVNGFTFATGATGSAVTFAAGGAGSDANIGLNINSKGTGPIALTSANASGTTSTSAFTFTDNSLNTGTGAYFTSSSLTTGKLVDISNTSNTQTTGTMLNISSTATSLTSGSLLSLDWSPGSSTTATGDLFSLNIGANALTTGNIFNIKNNTSSLFSVNPTQVTTSVPASFTAPGDISAAYDLSFTNPTASFIKSQAPLYIQSGEIAGSSDLTLKTFNEGSVVVDSSAITSNSLNIQSPAVTTGNGLLLQANALTTGSALNISSTTTAGTGSGNSYLINLVRSGTNTNATHNAFGIASTVTNTGTTSVNVAGYFSASGASTNYAIFTSGVGDIKASNIPTGSNANSPKLVLEGNGFTAAATNTTGSFSIQDQPGSATTAKLMFAVTGFVTNANLLSLDQSGAAILKSTLTQSSTPDYAENIPVSDQQIQAADVVTIDSAGDGSTYNNFTAKKAATPYDQKVLGVISTDPGVIINAPQDAVSSGKRTADSDRPLALAGRVPVKVSMENGPISRGDYLTTSSTPGYAMKATRPGQVIGKALEDWAGDQSGSTMGKILVFVGVTYADPTNLLANLTIDDQGNLVVPALKTNKITLPNVILEGSQSPIGSNQGSIASLQNDSYMIDSSSLTSIGSLASQNTKYQLPNTDLATIIQAVNDQFTTVQSQIQSQNQAIAAVNDQTNVLAEQIASQSAQIASLSAQIANINTASSSAVILEGSQSPIESTDSGSIASLQNDNDIANALTPPQIMFATESATVANLNVTNTLSSFKLDTLDATVSGTFKSLGDTTLGSTIIAGDLTQDGSLSITNGNSINSLGTLFIQNSPLANMVDIFNGAVTIDKTGSLVAQKVSANQYAGAKGLVTGSAKVLAGSTSIFISNPNITTVSRILLTPTVKTTSNLAVTSKQAGNGFIVTLSAASIQDVSFDWFVVEEK